MRSRFILAIALSLAASPLLAQSNDLGVWAAGSRVGSTGSGGASVSFDTGDGYAVSWNHYWLSHISTELAAGQLRNDGRIDLDGASLDLGRLKVKTATGTLQWHFAPSALLDPYIGAGAAYVQADDFRSSDLAAAGVSTIGVEKKWGFLANAGLNANILHNFGIGADVKYIPYEPNAGASSVSPLKLKLNPMIVSIGARLRF